MSRRKRKDNSTNGEKVVFVDGPWTPLVDDRGHPRRSTDVYSVGSGNGQPLKPVKDQCDTCPAKCCHNRVVLSIPDAIEFCQTLGIPLLSALRFSPAPSESLKSFLLNHDSRLNPECKSSEWSGKADIILPMQNNKACGYLIDIRGYKRCGVYAARPSICRTYPMTFGFLDEISGEISPEISGENPGLVVKSRVSCPAPFPVDAAMEKEFKKAALSSREKWLVHSQVVAEWEAFESEDGRTAENFLLFSIPRAAQLLGLPFHKVIFPRQLS